MTGLDDDQQTLLLAVVFALLAIGSAIGAVALWRRWQLRRRLQRREASITLVALAHVRNMLVADGNGGQLHLDWLLLTTRGLLLLDVRDVTGNVFGSEHMEHWTVMRGAGRNTFPNPLPTLLDRVAVLSRLVPQLGVTGRVVFTEGARFPKGVPVHCLRLDSLPAEFPVVDPGAAAALASAMSPPWERLLSQLTPNTAELKPL
jgi:hypothetical protein